MPNSDRFAIIADIIQSPDPRTKPAKRPMSVVSPILHANLTQVVGSSFLSVVEVFVDSNDIFPMEYFVPPVLIMIFCRFAFPALVAWFFERFVVTKDEIARQKSSLVSVDLTEVSKAPSIEATRKDLKELKRKLDNANGGQVR